MPTCRLQNHFRGRTEISVNLRLSVQWLNENDASRSVKRKTIIVFNSTGNVNNHIYSIVHVVVSSRGCIYITCVVSVKGELWKIFNTFYFL